MRALEGEEGWVGVLGRGRVGSPSQEEGGYWVGLTDTNDAAEGGFPLGANCNATQQHTTPVGFTISINCLPQLQLTGTNDATKRTHLIGQERFWSEIFRTKSEINMSASK